MKQILYYSKLQEELYILVDTFNIDLEIIDTVLMVGSHETSSNYCYSVDEMFLITDNNVDNKLYSASNASPSLRSKKPLLSFLKVRPHKLYPLFHSLE